jgi:putative flippase GtrA
VRIFFREAIRYTAASGCALVIDISILWALVRYLSWWYLAAAGASYLAGLIVGYVLSITLVFGHRRLRDSRLEFVSFAAIGAIGLAINVAVIAFLVAQLGLNYLVAKFSAAGFTFVWGFLARRQFLFVPRPLV